MYRALLKTITCNNSDPVGDNQLPILAAIIITVIVIVIHLFCFLLICELRIVV